MNFKKFFSELQRRNVYKVAIAYGITSWLLLQVADIIVPILTAPEWILKALLILLIVGFPIALIMSWVYEISPEGSLKTTKKIKDSEASAIKKKPIVLTILFGVLMLALAGQYIYFKYWDKENRDIIDVENSIAVLPFNNLSSNEDDQYFADGFREAVDNRLSNLKDIRVSSRASINQYRDSDKSVEMIGDELEVRYILEGTIQKIENQIRITVKLINVSNNESIWSKEYTEPVEDLLSIMSNVAESITSQLQLTLTPIEMEYINHNPTDNFSAYDLYMKGRMFYNNYLHSFKKDDIMVAEKFYKQSLEIDSSFALAYVGLGEISREKRGRYFGLSMDEKAYLDSIFIYSTKAIDIDPNLANAYALRGEYYKISAQIDNAISDQEKAISLNANLTEAYMQLGRIWFDKQNLTKAFRYLKTAQYYEKNGPLLTEILHELPHVYVQIGDYDKTLELLYNSAQLHPELVGFYFPIVWTYIAQGKFQKAIEVLDKACKNDSTGTCYFHYGMLYFFMEEYDLALNNFEKEYNIPFEEITPLQENDSSVDNHLIAYIYLKTGKVKEAMVIYDNILENKEKFGGLMAEVYAELEEYEKALEILLKKEQENPLDSGLITTQYFHIYKPLYTHPEYIAMIKRINDRREVARKQIEKIEKEGFPYLK